MHYTDITALPRTATSEKGSALALTLVVMALIAVIAFGILAVITSQSRTASSLVSAAKAYYMARIGIDRSLAELRGNAFWAGVGSEASPVSVSMRGISGTYHVTVLAKVTNPTSCIKYWYATSVGRSDGAKRLLTAWVSTESFAKFAYFTDYEYGYWATGNTFDGPVHTNGIFTMSGHPQYAYAVTCANVNTYSGGRNADEGWALSRALGSYKFKKQYAGSFFDLSDPSLSHFYCPMNSTSSTWSTWTDGPAAMAGSTDFSFSCAQPEIKLPLSTAGIKNAADISINPAGPASNTYYMKTYMDGDICRYQVRKNAGSGALLTPEPDPELPADATVHVNGKLYLEQSTIKGKMTVASAGDMYILGDITYSNGSSDMLGLVSEKNVYVDHPSGDIEIYGSILAISGAFKAKDLSAHPKVNMTLHGGCIAKSAGIFANPSNGYIEHYIFDTRFLSQSPRNFPVTGKMKIFGIDDNASLK
ncbi:MAG: hypothetical protein RDV48_17870 [Candidatus Eremiobacteraeota bacterium]|nr:hypothetical protein [Candidatus Eremiobacteraeota bacterium]